MAQTIKLKRSATPSAIPTTSNLELGELALNTNDAAIYIKRDDGTSPDDILAIHHEPTMHIDYTNNRIGIGTDSPTGLLHLSSSAPAFYMTDTTNNTEGVISMDNGGSLILNADLNNEAASSNIRFAVDGSEAMRIDSSGNVGIGTDAPGRMLHLNGSSPAIRLQDTDLSGYAEISANETNSGITFNADPTNSQANTLFAFRVDNSEVMRIDANGRVGIGTTSPLTSLWVQGASLPHATFANDDFVANTAGSTFDITMGATTGATYTSLRSLTAGRSTWGNLILQQGGGNVGIGTTSPDDILHLSSTLGTTLRIESTATALVVGNNIGKIEFEGQDAGGAGVASVIRAAVEGTAGQAGLAFDTGSGGASTERVRIDSSGNVGINQADPQTKTHITAAGSGSGVTDVLTIQTTRGDVGTAFAGGAINFVNSDGNSAGQARIKVGSSNDVATIGYNSESAQSFIFETSTSGSATTTNIDGNATTITVTHGTYSGFVPGQRIAINTGTYQGGYFIDTVTSDTEFTIADTDHDLAADSSGTPTIQYAVPRDSMIIRADGKVGIGTNSPESPLHVSAAVTHAAGTEVARIENTATGEPAALAFTSIADNGGSGNEGAIYFDAGADGTAADNQLQFNADHQTNTTPDMVITGDGKVGIGTGTGSPVEKLYVNSTSGDVRIGLNAPTGSDAEIKFFNNTVVNYTIGHDDATDNFVIGTTNVDFPIMSFTKGSNVGIGTSNPSNLLSLKSGTNTDIEFGSEADGGFIQTYNRTSSAYGYLRFITTAGSETMRLDTSGNVGIGTTSPDSTLTVFGTNNAAGGLEFQGPSATTGTSKVGRIKTQHYTNTEEPFTAILTNAQQSDNVVQIGGSSGAENAATRIGFWTASNNTTLTGTEVMRVNSAQNVGIGETSTMVADYKLQVRNDNNGESNPLLISNRDTSVGTTQNVSLSFGLSRDSGAFKPQAGRIRVGRESASSWDGTDANIDSYMDFSVYENNALSTKMTIQANGNVTFADGITTVGASVFNSSSATDPDSTSRANYPAGNMFTHMDIANGVSIIGGQGSYTGTSLTIGEEASRSANFNFIRGISDSNGTPAEEFSINGVGDAVFAGSVTATSKSFEIEHPTKPNHRLRYGSLEGPENGVYVRGRLSGTEIELPEYWTALVDPDSITVSLTPIGPGSAWVEKIENNKITTGGSENCFYHVFAERVDIEKLVVEYENGDSI